jgi:hypothetical protein
LISGLKAARAELAGEQAPAQLEKALLLAFREHAGQAVGIPQKNRSWISWRVAAAAAAILLVTSIGAAVFVRSILPGEVSTALVAPVHIIEPFPKVQNPDDLISQAETSRPVRKHPARRGETVTEYFSLTESEDTDFEFSQVVRVQLPASALREVGLPVSYASAGDQVKADIVLGHDGMARAIRFVR